MICAFMVSMSVHQAVQATPPEEETNWCETREYETSGEEENEPAVADRDGSD